MKVALIVDADNNGSKSKELRLRVVTKDEGHSYNNAVELSVTEIEELYEISQKFESIFSDL